LDYFPTEYEHKVANVFLGQYAYLQLPIVLLHCTGAIPSDGNFTKTNTLKDIDVPKLSEIVKRHTEKVLFIQIGLSGEPVVEGAIDALGMPMREAIVLIQHCTTFIFIESLFAHCSNALNKSGIVVFQNTDPAFFGYDNNNNVSWDGGCDIWPCNRPVGALLDINPGYRDPKTREPLLWECPKQLCKDWPAQHLEETLLNMLNKQTSKAPQSLADARATPPPQFSTIANPSRGKVTQGDPNVPVVVGPRNITNQAEIMVDNDPVE